MPGSSGVLGTPQGTEGGPAPSGAVLGGRVGGGGGTVEEGCGGEDTGTVRAQLGGGGRGRGSWETVTPQERHQRESEERGEFSWG